MKLDHLGDVELRYTSLDELDYEAGGQFYGTMEGSIAGERLAGRLRLTNLAPKRPDNVNVPTLRGVLETHDGAIAWVELDGVSVAREADDARVFVTICRFRTGDERYRWLNTSVALLEGVLATVGVGQIARGRLHLCSPTIT